MQIVQLPAAMLAVLFTLPVAAETASESMIRMHSEGDEFHLFDQQDEENLSFESPQTVSICVGQGRDIPALEVTHDDVDSVLAPGTCRDFTARRFQLSPAGPVDGNQPLVGTVERSSAGE